MLTATRLDSALPADHPLLAMKALAARHLAPMQPLLVTMAQTWPVTPPPDQGLMATLLMALYGIKNEHELCDEIARRQPFRWFLGLDANTGQVDAVSLAQMRSRLLRNSAAREFLAGTIAAARTAGLLADPHFTPDDQQITTWAV
jgi:hypothetical protein